MKSMLLFKPIKNKQVEDAFFRVLSLKYHIPQDLILALKLYHQQCSYEDGIYFFLSLLAGVQISLPSIDEMNKMLFSIELYYDITVMRKVHGINLDVCLEGLAKKYKKSSVELFSLYSGIREVLGDGCDNFEKEE